MSSCSVHRKNHYQTARLSGIRQRTSQGSETGASMAEFIIVAPVLLFLGLGALQLGLIYHGRTVLNYATFEAARTGAVNHALAEPMRTELAIRLAPLMSGDGSAERAAEAIARSVADLSSPIGSDGLPRPATTIERLNPTPEAFDDWGVHDPVAGRRVIPNSHLRYRHATEAPRGSGMSLRDANVLEIEVTHGLELKVPVVGKVLTTAMALVDPENAAWYASNRLPLSSVATVRMQSNVWMDDDQGLGSSTPEGSSTGDDDQSLTPGEGEAADRDNTPADSGGNDGASSTDEAERATDDGESTTDSEIALVDAVDGSEPQAEQTCGEYGLGGDYLPVSESAYLEGTCLAEEGVHDAPVADREAAISESGDPSPEVNPLPQNC